MRRGWSVTTSEDHFMRYLMVDWKNDGLVFTTYSYAGFITNPTFMHPKCKVNTNHLGIWHNKWSRITLVPETNIIFGLYFGLGLLRGIKRPKKTSKAYHFIAYNQIHEAQREILNVIKYLVL